MRLRRSVLSYGLEEREPRLPGYHEHGARLGRGLSDPPVLHPHPVRATYRAISA